MSLDKRKTDPILGEKVKEHLIKLGVETPMTTETLHSSELRKSMIADKVKEIMQLLGLDTKDDSLVKTPSRIANMYMEEVFWGLNYDYFPKTMVIENKMQYDSVLLERKIKVHSMCEHHFVPIIGEAFVAYIPGTKVIGLSKINRIVEFFCRRPQVQERLCEQIYHALVYLLETEDVAVLIRAEHCCVKLRGVEDMNSDTITSKIGGAFISGTLRNEFYQMIREE